MSENYFVNRRGRKKTVDGMVDEISAEETRTKTPEVKATKQPRRLSPPKIHIAKKLWLIPLACLVVLAIAALVVVDASRRDYQRQTVALKSSVHDISAQTSSTELPAIDVVRGLSGQLNASVDCQSSMPLQIINAYAPARDARQECQDVAKQYSILKQSLGDMEQLLDYLGKQNQATSAALAQPAGAFAEIPTKVTAWDEAHTALEALSPPESVRLVHSGLVSKVASIRAAWSDLQAAFNTQQKESFTGAEAKLAQAYEALRTSGDEFDRAVVDHQNDIDAAVRVFTSD